MTALQQRTMELVNHLMEEGHDFNIFKKKDRVGITVNTGSIFVHLFTSETKCGYGGSYVWYVFSSSAPYEWGEEISTPTHNRRESMKNFTYKLWNHDMALQEIGL